MSNDVIASSAPTSPTLPAREGKYLTFALGEEEYAVGILKVREILGMLPIRPIPYAPAHIKGVVNLRGKVVPVMDLRLRLGLEARPHDERTCIIVIEAWGTTGRRPVGLVVDEVNEVANIRGEQLEPPPSFGVSMDTSCILGMAKTGAGVRILLDMDQVLSGDDLAGVGLSH